MTHLTEAEFVDLVDGTLAPARAAHLDALRRRAARRGRDARRARAGRGRRRCPSRRRSSGSTSRRACTTARARRGAGAAIDAGSAGPHGATVKWAMAGALLTLAARVRRLGRALAHERTGPGRCRTGRPPRRRGDRDRPRTPHRASCGRRPIPTPTRRGRSSARSPTTCPWDDAAAVGFGVRPGAAERALATLTRDERSELVRLLAGGNETTGRVAPEAGHMVRRLLFVTLGICVVLTAGTVGTAAAAVSRAAACSDRSPRGAAATPRRPTPCRTRCWRTCSTPTPSCRRRKR